MAKGMTVIKDALVSLVNGLGIQGKDKAASVSYASVTLTDQQLLTMYRTAWLPRKIVNIPAADSFRAWRDWQAETSDITLIETEERRLDLKRKLVRTKTRARLFGGAALFIGTGDPDLAAPLEIERVKKNGIRYVSELHRRQLRAGPVDLDPESPLFNTPMYYELALANSGLGPRIHPSRLVIFNGEELPDEELSPNPHGRGWGDSSLLAILDAIKNMDSTSANIASLIFEAKIDIIRVPDLMASLADPVYEQQLLERFALANSVKGNNGLLLLDKEEEYDQKSTTFATLPDIMQSFMQIVSGAADIPVTRLLGQSPAGMNATGEGDLRNYYDMVKSEQETDITPAIYNLDECLIRSALGARPDDLHYKWASLWQMSDKERAEIGNLDSQIIERLHNTGLFPPEALANAGANMLVEHAIMPGLSEEIEAAGGLPDYDMGETDPNVDPNADPGIDPNRPQTMDAAPKSLYVRRDVLNGDAIRKHYADQGLTVTVENLHITIIHSRRPVDWFEVGDAWDAKITLNAGGARDHELFGPPGLQGSLVLMIKSRELEWRHAEFKRAGAVSDFIEYQPHITLIYKSSTPIEGWQNLKPYVGEIELGPEMFEEVK